jgi:hypothetical protein
MAGYLHTFCDTRCGQISIFGGWAPAAAAVDGQLFCMHDAQRSERARRVFDDLIENQNA